MRSRNFFSSTTICSTSWKEFLRFPCLRTETRKSWNWNFVKIEIDENYSDLRGSLKTNIPLRGSGPWLGRKWCNNTRDRARLSTRTNVPSPIKRHGSVIAEIVRGRYAKRRFRSFIAIENIGQERRMRGKASTFPAIEKKEKFLPVLFLFFFFMSTTFLFDEYVALKKRVLL